MVVYTLVSPLVGWLGDRVQPQAAARLRRRPLERGDGRDGVRRGFNDMFFWRALLGVGEASYGIIAPALLADLFSPKQRGRVMGLYYLALPLGGAIGYVIGGHFAQHWRLAACVLGRRPARAWSRRSPGS